MPRTSPRRTASAKRRLEFGDGDTHDEANTKPSPTPVATVATAVPPGTPETKKCRREGGIAGYFSSPSKTTATKASEAALVTPEKESQPHTDDEDSERTGGITAHVPVHIHKNLGYQRRGQALLNATTLKAFCLVEEHCGIPTGFENDRAYGPLSGTCFEERLLDAYDRGLIGSRTIGGGIRICTHCADLGHGRDDCPLLI